MLYVLSAYRVQVERRYPSFLCLCHKVVESCKSERNYTLAQVFSTVK